MALESTETSIEKARAQGQWAQASVELEEWVTAGRQLVDAQLPWVQSSGSAGALQSASANPVPQPKVARGVSGGGLFTPRLGRVKSSAPSSALEDSLSEVQHRERLAAAEKTLKKAGYGSESVSYICSVSKHNEHGKVRALVPPTSGDTPPQSTPPSPLPDWPQPTRPHAHAQVQERTLVVTNVAVYNLDPGSSAKLKRRVLITSIGSVTINEPQGQLALHVPSEYDYFFTLSQAGYDVSGGEVTQRGSAGEPSTPGGGGGAAAAMRLLSPCHALAGALQKAYVAQHAKTGETLVVRTFNGNGTGGSLKEMLQTKQRRGSGRDSGVLSLGSIDGDLSEEDDDETENSTASASGRRYPPDVD